MRATFILISTGLALVISNCSDDKGAASSERGSQAAPGPKGGGPEAATPAKMPGQAKDMGGIDTERLAGELGVPADMVSPMLADVRKYRDDIDARLHDSRALADVVRELSQLADRIAAASEPLPLADVPGSAFTLANLARGPTDAATAATLCRSGFLGLPADQIPNQLKLYSATQEIARMKADQLGALLSDRAAAATPTAADCALFVAVVGGLQDNPELHHADTPRAGDQNLPYTRQLLQLSEAKNAVFRLLSIMLAPQLERDPAKLAKFYEQFSNEGVEAVRRAAADRLVNL